MSPQTLLYVESGLALGLLLGAGLARALRYRLHGWLQTLIVVANLGLILAVMRPSLSRYLASSSHGEERFFVYGHATLGAVAELMGLYIVLAAGPKWFKLKSYKLWMRTTLVLWLAAFGLGAVVYSKLNGGSAVAPRLSPPSPPVTETFPPAAPATPQLVRISFKNFGFDPKEVTVPVGTEVEWYDEGGRHSVQADDGSFKSDPIVAGGTFRHKFDKPGRYDYFCEFHGSAGGHDMAGTVVVK